jgi:lipid-A-disaccharide synthase
MHALAPELEDWIEEAAVVGLVEVLKKYGYFRQKMAQTLQAILSQNPTAVILIDYPGFNLRLAAALRKRGYRGKIIYYISPQVWAWHRSRIPKMAAWLNLMLCIFPFEKDLYNGFGLKTEFAGHPLVAWHRQQHPPLERDPRAVGLFPGSRGREVLKIWPILLASAVQMHQAQPTLRFYASAASPRMENLMRELAAPFPALPLTLEQGTMVDRMRTCAVGAVASGTATLEASILGLPYVLVYKVSSITYAVGRRLIKVPHLGMINILAGRLLVQELLQQECTAKNVSHALTELLHSPEKRAQLTAEMQQVITQLGEGDAYARAAMLVRECLRG